MLARFAFLCAALAAGPTTSRALANPENVSPAIVSQPVNHTAFEGDDHTFTLAATGTSPLHYQWFFDGALLDGATSDTLPLTGLQPDQAGAYHAVVSNAVGMATSRVATLDVRLPSDPRFATPQGGWNYILTGDDVLSDDTAALDGSWDHFNGSDSWGGDGRGAGVGFPGGISTAAGIMTIEDASTTGSSTFDNRRIYLTHDFAQESNVDSPATLLDEGVTLSFRARLTPPPPADPLTELPNAPNGYVNVSDGKGMFGIRQSANGGALISFTLHQALEDRSTTTSFNFGQAGLHMNNLNGDVAGTFVDPSEGGTLNVLALDSSVFHEFWITIQANGSDPGTHRVAVYIDGEPSPQLFQVTAGLGSDTPSDNYLALGLGNTLQLGAFDVDYFAYKTGVITPIGFNVPLSITKQPATQYIAQGQTATFNVVLSGTPPYFFQWYRDNSAILNATNQSYSTPATVPADDGALFTVVAWNDVSSVTSSPPASLELVPPPLVTSHPQSLVVTNGDTVTFQVSADSQTPLSYQWRRNGLPLTDATNASVTFLAVSPSQAGDYDVRVTNVGGTVSSDTATLTVEAIDFGDAPDSPFPSLLANNGARHRLRPNVYLGATVDFELNALPTANADGDDNHGADDEDGVVFPTPLRAGQQVTVNVTASTAGFLDAWIDFNRNGAWDVPGEVVFESRAVSAGVNPLGFNVPASAQGGASFGRFRFSTSGGLAPTGPAADGEVEDEPLTIIPVADVSVSLAASLNPVAVSSNLTLTITVSNLGPSLATGVMVTNGLPAQFNFESANPSQGSCAHQGGVVTCNLGAIPPGQSALITIAITPIAAGDAALSSSAFASELDLATANNTTAINTLVLDPPVVTTDPSSLVVTNGHNALFQVTATGAAPLEYQWRFNNNDLADETNANLTILSAAPGDEGAYAVRVRNRVGAVTSGSATLTVLVPPSIIDQPSGGAFLAGASATLSVTAAGTEPLNYQWFYNETTPLPNATNNSLTLESLETADAGDYTVRVGNPAGLVVSSPANVIVRELDFGDAPDPAFPTLLAHDGARHEIAPLMFLGQGVEFEPDGQPSGDAQGDDVAGLDDEDGIRLVSSLLVGQSATLEVVASTSGFIDAWIDWHLDGSWLEPGDQIADRRVVSAGTNLVPVLVPVSALPGLAMARFRYSSAGGLSPNGEAPDGEVEDMAFTVNAAVDLKILSSVAPSPVAVGSNWVWTVALTNAGPSVATDVFLTNSLPATVTIVQITSSQGVCQNDSGLILCDLGGFNPSAGATVQVTAIANVAGNLTNVSSAASAEAELSPSDNAVTQGVQVLDYPAILTQPVSVIATNGNNVQFTVVAVGTDLEYQWRRNGSNLNNVTNNSISLTGVGSAQEGTYDVIVHNAVGQVTSDPATLTVLQPVTISQQPASQTVVEGQSAIFSVTAGGTPPLTYQWLFNNSPLESQNAAQLTLNNLTADQAGPYRVEVGNVIGSVLSAAATLTVLIPPTITSPPAHQTNRVGTTATMSVGASGTAPLRYQWFFNETTPLPNATNATLSLPNVQTNQSGFYSVTIRNAAGTNTSNPAFLAVFETDLGDAPDPYPTLGMFDGARHRLMPGFHLGASVDFEPDGLPSSLADGDDLDGTDDEDGVTFLSALRLGQNALVEVVASADGYLDVWIDFNQNMQWVDPGDFVLHSHPLVAGANSVNLPIHPYALLGSTYARFRFSSTGGLGYTGEAVDGEVEDYRVEIDTALDVLLVQQATPNPVLMNGALTFSIAVSNAGPAMASGITLTNVMPPGFELSSFDVSQGSCSETDGHVVCDLGSLAPSAQVLLNLIGVARAPGVLTNVASVAAVEFDVNPANNTQETSVPVIMPTVRFAKNQFINGGDIGPAKVYPSTLLVSGLTATVYKVTATLSNLAHTFPDDFDILLVGPQGQSSILISDAGGGSPLPFITFTLDDDAPSPLPDAQAIVPGANYQPTDDGAEPDTFPAPAPSGPYSHQLGVFQGTDPNGVWSLFVVDDFELDAGVVSNGWSIAITPFEPFADLAVHLAAAANPVALNSNVVFTVTVTNSGPAVATQVQLLDSFPSSVSAIEAIPSQGGCEVTGLEVRCDLGDVPPLSSVQVVLHAQANMLGPLTNHAEVSAHALDLIPINNSANAVVLISPVIDLALAVVDSPDPVLLGQSFTYAITVTNQGANLATGVRVGGALPEGWSAMDWNTSQGACVYDAGVVLCDLGDLAPSSSATVSIILQAAELGVYTNDLVVTATEIDGDFDNNRARVETTVLPAADLALNASAAPNPVVATLNSTLSLLVSNAGPSQATQIVLSNQVPANALVGLVTSSQGSCSDDGAGHVVCDLGDLDAGATAIVTIPLTCPQSGTLNLIAEVRAFEADPNPADNVTQTALEVLPVADLELTVSHTPNPVALQSPAIYSFVVENLGPDTAGAILFTNPIPTQLSFVAVDASQGACQPLDGTVRCDLGSLGAGGLVTIEVTVIPLQAGVVVNSASVVSVTTADLNPANNTAEDSANVFLQSPTFADTNQLLIGDSGPAAVYPSIIMVSGLTTAVHQVFVTLSNLHHPRPDDLDILLAGPGGQTALLISDAGGAFAVTNLNLVLTATGAAPPDESSLASGSYATSDYDPDSDAFAPPAPPGPYASDLGVFQHTDPNGAWSLYIQDDESPHSGGLLDGWSLVFTTLEPLADIAVSAVAAPNPVTATSNLTVTITVTNHGPALAQFVDVLTTLSPATLIAEAISTQGSCSIQDDQVTCDLGDLQPSQSAVVTISMVPAAPGTMDLAVSATTASVDATPANNQGDLTVEVERVNHAPVISDIPNATTQEDSPVATLFFTVDDEDSGPEGLIVTVSSSNETLAPPSTLRLEGTGSSRTLDITPAADQFGDTLITLTARDPMGLEAQDTFMLSVEAVNDAPTLDPIADQTIDEETAAIMIGLGGISSGAPNEDQSLLLTATSGDPDLIPTPVILYSSPGNTGTLILQPVPNVHGSTTISVTVDDGGAEFPSVTRQFTVTVRMVNTLPSISTIPDSSVLEDGVTPALPFTVQDAETPAADLQVMAFSSDPEIVSPNDITLDGTGEDRTVTLRPVPDAFGAALITLRVYDTDLGTNETSFLVTVDPVNDPPILSAIANQEIDANDVLGPVDFTVQDIESAANLLVVRAFSSNSDLLLDGNIIIMGDSTNRTLQASPVPDQTGSAQILIEAVDPDGATNQTSFLLRVGIENEPPTLSRLNDRTISEDLSLVINVVVGDLETAPADLQVTATSDNPTLLPDHRISLVSANGNRTFTMLPTPNESGTALVTITVQDEAGAQTIDSFLLTVGLVNDPPTLDPLPDLEILEATGEQIIELFGISSGAPNENQTLLVTATSSYPGLIPHPTVNYSSPDAFGSIRFTPVPGKHGLAQISVTVHDGDVVSSSVTVEFAVRVVRPNRPPFISPLNDLGLDEDSASAPIPVSVLDPDGLAADITLTASSSNPDLIPDSGIVVSGADEHREIVLSPLADQFGGATISLLATDAMGSSHSISFALTVSPVNDPPELDPLPDATVDEDHGPLTVDLTGIRAGPANEIQTLLILAASSEPDLIPAPEVMYSSPDATGQLTLTPAANASGSALITVTLQDSTSSNHVAIQSFTVTVNPVNDLPNITNPPDIAIDEDQTAGPIHMLVSDIETAPDALLVSVASSNPALLDPAGVEWTSPGAVRTLLLSPEPDQTGMSRIGVTVDDGQGGANLVEFLLTVQAINDPPVITGLNDLALDEDTASPLLNFQTQDPDSPVETLGVEIHSDEDTLFPPGSLVLGGTGADRTLEISPAPNQFGTALLTIRATDETGQVGILSFQVNVLPVNDPPALEPLPDQFLEQGQILRLAVALFDVDSDPSDLALTVSSDDPVLLPEAGLESAGTGLSRTISGTPSADHTGSALVTVAVEDGEGGVIEQSFQVTVSAGAAGPPRLLTHPSSQTVSTGASLVLSASATGSEPLLFQWERDGVPLPNATSPTLTLNNVQPANAGSYRLLVSNTAGSAASETAMVLVRTLTLSAIANQVTAEDTPLAIPFTVGAQDEEVLDVTLSATSGNPALIAQTNLQFSGYGTVRTLSLMPTTNLSGTATLTVLASNRLGVASRNFNVTVNAVNDPPTLNPIPDMARNEAANPFSIPITGIGSGAPNESQTLSVSAVSSDIEILNVQSVSYSSPEDSASLNLKPINNRVGPVTITVTVTDGAAANNQTERTFVIYSKDADNVAPTISAIAARSINEDSTTGPVAFTVGDAETAANSLAVTALSSNPDLLSAAGLVLGGAGGNRTLTVTPLPNRSGTVIVTLEVVDGSFGYNSTPFTLTVNPVNDPPALNPLSDLVLSEDTRSALLPLIVSDAESTAASLSVSVSSDDQTLLPDLNMILGGQGASRALQLQPATNQFGAATVTVFVDDNQGGTTNQSFLVTVTPINDPPSINDLLDQRISGRVASPPILVTIGDVETDAADLLVSVQSSDESKLAPEEVAVTGSGGERGLVITPSSGNAGSVLLTVQVADTEGATAEDTFVVTIDYENTAPNLDPIADLVLDEDAGLQAILLTGIAAGSVSENQWLAITAISDNTNLIATPLVLHTNPAPDAVLLLTPKPDAHGEALITVMIDDGQMTNNLLHRSFLVTVNPIDDPPILTGLADVTLLEDQGSGAMPFTLDDAETLPDDLTLTVSSSDPNLLPEEGILVLGTGSNLLLELNPAPEMSGTATVTLQADDGAQSTELEIAVVVVPVNDLPTLDGPQDQSLVEDATLGPLAVTVQDIESSADLLILAAVSGDAALLPADGLITTGTGTDRSLTLSPAPHQSGTTFVDLLLHDPQGGAVASQFQVIVTGENDPPTLNGLRDVLVTQGQSASLTFLVTDIESPAERMTVTVASSDETLFSTPDMVLSGDGPFRNLTLIAGPDQVGTATITVQVTDTDAGTVMGQLQASVTAANEPPAISPIADQTTPAETPVGPLEFTVSDAETPAADLTVAASSSDTTLVPLAGLMVTGTDGQRAISVSPAPGQAGKAVITLTVSDTDGAQRFSSFILEVTSPPESPQILELSLNGATAELTFTTDLGRRYTVEYAAQADSPAWDALPAVLGTGSPMTVSDDITNVQTRFYRVRTE